MTDDPGDAPSTAPAQQPAEPPPRSAILRSWQRAKLALSGSFVWLKTGGAPRELGRRSPTGRLAERPPSLALYLGVILGVFALGAVGVWYALRDEGPPPSGPLIAPGASGNE